MIRTARWFAVFAIGAVFGSCGGGAANCKDGKEACPCVNGFACDLGLECRSGYCVNPNGPSTTTVTGGTDGSGSASASGGSSDSNGDSGGGSNGQFCLEECSADEDCLISGADQGFACEGSRCVGGTTGCADDLECIATFSGFFTTCTSTADCPGQECIDIGDDNGWCATIPSEFVACDTINMEEVLLPLFDGTGDVLVCAAMDARCGDEGYCENPCKADADCVNYLGHPVCDTGTGRCGCSSDSDCAESGQPGWAVCNGGVCGCAEDADCEGTTNADTCYDGLCGCSDVSVCTSAPAFDGTTQVCDKL